MDNGNNGFSTKMTFLDLGSVNKELQANSDIINRNIMVKLTHEIHFLDDPAS